MLILEAPPFACFVANCEKGFCDGFGVSGELEMLILGFGCCSCSTETGGDGASVALGCEAGVVLLLSSPPDVDCAEACDPSFARRLFRIF